MTTLKKIVITNTSTNSAPTLLPPGLSSSDLSKTSEIPISTTKTAKTTKKISTSNTSTSTVFKTVTNSAETGIATAADVPSVQNVVNNFSPAQKAVIISALVVVFLGMIGVFVYRYWFRRYRENIRAARIKTVDFSDLDYNMSTSSGVQLSPPAPKTPTSSGGIFRRIFNRSGN